MHRLSNIRFMYAVLLSSLSVLLQCGASASAQPLRLESLLAAVGDGHPRIRAALAEIDVQRGRKLQAIAPPAPTLTFHEEEITSGAALGSGNQRIWQVSQGFDLPLLVGSRGYVFGHLQRAAEHRLAVARAMVRAEIVTAYAAWYARLHQWRLQKVNHSLAAEFSRKAQLRHDRGESGALEAARARAEEAAARIALAQARSALTDAAAGLEAATARDIPDIQSDNVFLSIDTLTPIPASRLDVPPVVDVPIDDAMAGIAVPLVEAAREERDAAHADASWRWMEFLPRFEAAWFRQDFKDIGPHWGAELTATVPLWFLLDTRGSIAEHEAVARQADARYDQTMREMQHSLRQARHTLEAATAAIVAYDADLLREAERIARVAELGYENGEIGYMEYLSARQSANSIFINYYQALVEQYAAAARYELVTGTSILE